MIPFLRTHTHLLCRAMFGACDPIHAFVCIPFVVCRWSWIFTSRALNGNRAPQLSPGVEEESAVTDWLAGLLPRACVVCVRFVSPENASGCAAVVHVRREIEGQGAKGKEQRARSKEQRAKSKEHVSELLRLRHDGAGKGPARARILLFLGIFRPP